MIGFQHPWILVALAVLPALWYPLRRDSRRRWILSCRLAATLLLILAAAGPKISTSSDTVHAVFVLDVSDSMGGSDRDALEKINRLLRGMRGDDRSALVTVASAAAVEVPLRPGGAAFGTELLHDGGASRLADGLYTAVGALDETGVENRIVLISDGRDDGGGLAEALEFARRSGITVDAWPAGEPSDNEVLVESVSVPARMREGDVHSLSAVFRAEQPVAARILIARDGELIGEDRVTLNTGVQRQSWEMPALAPGSHEYEVILDPAVDGRLENNRGLAVTTVAGRPRVLWVGRGESAVPRALEVQGHIVRKVLPGDLPDSLAGYDGLEAVILDNVSAREMSLRSMDLLESWVRTRGGGLMMVGGDEAFGPGGWQATSIEQALPVVMDAPSSLYIPSLTMVMVVDKSGSMGGEASPGFTKLDLVKEAVLGAAEVLNPLFSVGLLAFDADWEWTVPVTEAGNASEIRQGLAGLKSGGGTVLYPAVKEAYDALVASPAAVRHLVILSDGLTEKADFERLTDAIVRDGISVSTVAVGADAGHELMQTLARRGRGRYWFAEDATQVPRIFASESMIVSRGLIVEETLFPEPAMAAEALNGVDLSLTPPIHGYVMTYPDPAAVEALRSPRGHPLLVYGQHGLGRTVAFTSDLRAGWGRDWAAWDQLPRILSQTVRWMNGGSRARDSALSMVEKDGTLSLVLEARNPSGSGRSDLNPRATLMMPDQEELEISLTMTAPGQYRASFRPTRNGVYSASVSDEAAGLLEEAWWTRAYAPELGRAGVDAAAMAEAARIGGGRLLDSSAFERDGIDGDSGSQSAEEWWTVRNPLERTRADLTALLALVALMLFLTDIALRESAGWRRAVGEQTGRRRPDMETLILKGREEERHKPKNRRPTPAQAARILAQRRQEKNRSRDGGE